MDDYIVKDSSVWPNSIATAGIHNQDMSVKLGMVRENYLVENEDGSIETRYVVEVTGGSKGSFPVQCIRGSRFGGIYNYEEYTLRGFDPGQDSASYGIYAIRPGDMVVVAFFHGDSREGIILTHVNHTGRKEKIEQPDGDFGVEYYSEFNGIETIINADGEYTRTFRGQPTNLDMLKEVPSGSPLPEAEYDEEVGTSYYKWDKTGSWELSDNAKEDLQSIKVDKPNGQIIITSGKTTLTIDKTAESYEIVNKKTTFTSADEFNVVTKKTDIKSDDLVNVKTKEMIVKAQQLFDLKATDIKTDGKWDQKGDMKILGNIQQTGNATITGNVQCIGLQTSGPAMIAGGQFPLIYDIVLIIGTGNAGAPVISTATVLKTALTKAS